MTCELCRDEQEGGFRARCPGIELVDACPTGEVPKLSAENRRFWLLFERILPGLFDGWGGVNYSAIREVLDLYEVPAGERPIAFDKCLVVVEVIQEIREKVGSKQ